MAYELLTILLGGCAGIVAMLYLASRGKTGQVNAPVTVASHTAYAPTTTEQAHEVPAVEAPFTAEPAPSPAPAMYETVQPAQAPVTYAAPSSTSFGAPALAKKPTRTYRRRTAPVRSAASKKSLASKSKKR